MAFTHFLSAMGEFFGHIYKFDLNIGVISYALIPIGAYIAYLQKIAISNDKAKISSFIAYILPDKSNIKRKYCSYRIDVLFSVIKYFVNSLFLIPIMVSNVFAAHFVYTCLVHLYGLHESTTPETVTAYTLICLCILLQDFVEFFIHYSHHHLQALWDIHKVHHSTEFMLIPFSVKRTHILEEMLSLTITSLAVGIFIGFTSYALSIEIWDTAFYGIDAWFLMQLASFWHLRHSHINLSYGWLENIFLSPAQHQLHHSYEVEHWDKNFGLLFSFWDRMFGCFLRSVPAETYRIGLNDLDKRDYDTVWKLFVSPFVKIYQAGRRHIYLRKPVNGVHTDAAK